MSVGGGGYGGGGLPYPTEVLQLWCGTLCEHEVPTPAAPTVLNDDGSGEHRCAIHAIGPQGRRAAASSTVKAAGLADAPLGQFPGGDAYVVLRDGKEITRPLRIGGSQTEWTDRSR